ncbi:MAG: SpoIIE family protein phosphatase [Bdellovibrionaceae bacterium]|nr:SpoIIE family protein phosphatase [Pseudobdellovibrionaceae bacterium]
MKTQGRILLRYKLLALLALMPITFLAIYLVLATNLFKNDKKVYIFDSSVFMSRSLALQIKMEIAAYKRSAAPVLEAINFESYKFSPRSISFFEAQKRIEHLIVLKKQHGKNGKYVETDYLKAENREVKELVLDPENTDKMRTIALKQGIMISDYKAVTRYFLIIESHFPEKDPRHFMTLAVYKAPEIFEAFATPNVYKSFLISRSRFISMRPLFIRSAQDKVRISNFDFFNTIITQQLPDGTTEVKTEEGHPTLVSFSDVGVGDLMVVSVVDKIAAFKTIDDLIYQSILFFVAIICIAIFISVISSISLTSAISKLMHATEQIGEGNFLVDLKLNSRDEFGELARRFSTMADKVSSLLTATAEKARMENELEMVRVVQENLFPPSSLEVGPIKIISHFEPASECGGDWFHYSQIAGKVYLWIGDATGHGAPAALITGAAKSAASIIETSEGITPGQALEVMNHALHSTAHGSILMTFFLAVIDPESGIVTYANASHEFPYVVPDKKGLKKKDLIPLCESKQGKRLGEEKNSKYDEATYQLQQGDSIVFYTDGVIDLQNIEGAEMGERSFIKAILTATEKSPHLAGRVDNFKKIIKEYRGNAILVDDVTMFWIQYKKI